MFKTKNHTFLRFIMDIFLLLILFAMIILPVYLTFTMKIKDLSLKTLGIERVAGTSTNR